MHLTSEEPALHTPPTPSFRWELYAPCLLMIVFYLLALSPYLVLLLPARPWMSRTFPSIKRGLRGLFLFFFLFC